MTPQEQAQAIQQAILFVKAAAIAGTIAAVVILLGGLPWKSPRTILVRLSQVLGVAIAIYVGCWFLGFALRWPTTSDSNSSLVALPLVSSNQDRLFLLVLPAVVLVEILASVLGRFRLVAWIPRLAIAMLAARVILHNGKYIKDYDGPGSAAWNPDQIKMYLGGMGVLLAAVWASLARMAKREAGQWSVPLALAITCAGGGTTVVLTGDVTDGRIGVAVSGALIGAVVGLFLLSGRIDVTGMLGLGVVTLFCVLLAGLFFSELKVLYAALIFAAPLLAWLVELPFISQLKPTYRGLLRIALTAAPVIVAVVLAGIQFQKDSVATSSDSDEPTAEDYMNFGK
jgi:hypothetical protein